MSGAMAGRGRPGPAGPQGPTGPQGEQGPAAFTLAIGDVSAVPYGDQPEATNVGTDTDQVWDLKLVTGATGVLVGDSPPTGQDGTSVGQLYFCTANQIYYGLIEQSEDGNKWRPIMTQESAITTKVVDIFTYAGSTQAECAGKAVVIFDDVRQQISISMQIDPRLATAPINGSCRIAISQRVYAELQALSEQRGVHALPVPVIIRENSVDSNDTLNLIGTSVFQEGVYNATFMAHLRTWFPAVDGDGANPGVAPQLNDGEVDLIRNETSPGAATTYGNVSFLGKPMAGDLLHALRVLPAGDTYPKTIRSEAAAVIPYA